MHGGSKVVAAILLTVLALGPLWAAERITTVAGARVRDAPEPDAGLVAVLPFGSVVMEQGRGEAPQTIGGNEDFWYRVSLPEGGEGWIFGALTRPFEPTQAAEIYRELARQRLDRELAFAEQVELTVFLDRVRDQVMEPAAAGELALAHLRSVRRSLDHINVLDFNAREDPAYQQWLAELESQGLLTYSEPSAEYLIPLARIWALHDAFYPLAVADEIAWLAVTNPWAGECEGYLPCYLEIIDRTSGRYLKLHPGDQHAGAALDNIASFLAPDLEFSVVPEDLPTVNRQLAVLAATLERVPEAGELPAQLAAFRRRVLEP